MPPLSLPTNATVGWVSLMLALAGVACGGPAASTDGTPGAGGSGSGTSESGGSGFGGEGGAATGGGSSGGAPGAGGAGGTVTSCEHEGETEPVLSCRDNNDCGGGATSKCCIGGCSWPPSACPLPPSSCSTNFVCTPDSGCQPGGTCVSTISGCPQCEQRQCVYPAPPCTQSPDSCGSMATCQSDGTCSPIRCDAGHVCADDSRCNLTSPRADTYGCEKLPCDAGYACADDSRCDVNSPLADTHGCEKLPCDDGWTCEANTRCTTPTEAAPHGCTALPCTEDCDCDSGYCVNGICSNILGTCSFAPQ